MTPVPQWALEGGGWGLLVIMLVAFTFAISRGILVRGAEIDRREREREKDVDRVLALYAKQIDALERAAERKDATIAKLTEQNDKLMSHSSVSAHAWQEIIEEAKRRGLAS